MVDLMEKAWREYIETLKPEHQGVKNGMDFVLRRMEKEKILPPKYEKMYKPSQNKAVYVNVNEWEPEE